MKPISLQPSLTHRRACFPGDKPTQILDLKSLELPGGVVGHRKVSFSLHNGAHADQPAHVSMNLPAFPESHYQGSARILDLRPHLKTRLAISPEILKKSSQNLKLKIPDEKLQCLLFQTGYIGEDPAAPHKKEGFPHLGENLITFIKKNYPNLKVIGIDTPSVDARGEKELAKKRHGELFSSGIAPLEGLCFQAANGPMEGHLFLNFDSLRMGMDAIGVNVFLILKI